MVKCIPVLMYHHVLPVDGFLAISIENFKAQMEFLKKKNYYTLSSEEFLAFKKGLFIPPRKSVFITFDDGWRDIYVYAYPILKRLGLKATAFLITSWVERASQKKTLFEPLSHKECKKVVKTAPEKVILNWKEIEIMKDCFDFHSHTHSHFEESLTFEEEFLLSKEILKNRLGIDSKHLCWPRGFFSTELILLAKKYGYKIFYTTKRGTNLPDGNLDLIKRIAVKPSTFWLKKTLFIYSHRLISSVYESFKKL